MKQEKYRFYILVLLIGSFSILAVPAQTTDELVWQLKHFGFEEFSLEAPFGFESSGFKKDDSARNYSGTANGIYLYAFSDSLKKKSQFNTVSNFVSDSTGVELKTPAKPFEYSKVEFMDRFGYYNRVLVIWTDNRLYTFQTVSKSAPNRISTRFLASIWLGQNGPRPPIPADEEASKVSGTQSPNSSIPEQSAPSIKPNFGTGAASGAGQGNGSGIGAGSVTAGSRPTTERVPLKILSKPRAIYTDLARFYGISGSVTLRLTLLANGSIGSVTPTSTLPFGLTETAVAAARKVEFEPPKEDGVPRTVSKTFVYSFTIY